MVMNLNEVEERDQYEKDRAKFCSWSDCPFNIMRSPGSLHVCRGCGEVRYCGRECQIKDWKEDGHKWKCKRLKAA
ncbi:hypothetical protein OF83DRAFT_1098558 [Amylostereum chailletii]|nr:hypothetical protein OF83DRAFT_1098558 [Amylostereum chailletii]